MIGRQAMALLMVTALFRVSAGAETVKTLLTIDPTKQYPRNSEGDVVELKDGRLCLVYSRFTGGTHDDAKADIAARTSNDGGKTWTDDRVLVKNEGKDNTMSVSLLRLRNSDVLLFYLRKNAWNDCNLYVRRSADEFATLSDPVRVTTDAGYHVVNNARVIQLSTGRIVVPAAFHPCPDGTPKTWSGKGIPRAFLSDDDGRTWRGDATVVSPPPKRAATPQEPGVLELKDGRLWMWMRTTQGTQYESFSADQGVHWSEPRPGNLASPCSPATIGRIPWTGDLLCVWNDHSGWHAFPPGKRTPLCVAISKDDGRTWSKSRVIEGDPNGWYCYTSMTFLKDRVILSYCAGDTKVGGLNRLKVTVLWRDWLYMP
jgi:sialidase-1